ncbi:MAG TPA: glycerophosphodiester phosphodiesterase family protein [Pelobium sp.]
MKTIYKISSSLLLIFFLSHLAVAQTPSPVDSILMILKDQKTNQVLVVSHRADWRNFPENSIEGIESAIAMGVDMVEIDIHKTKDGQLVLMHDNTIDRTTNGKGKVSDWTLDSLKTLSLKNGLGIVKRYKIPTLEEAMLAAKGKVLVNLDKCYNYFPEAYEILKKTNTINQAVMKASKPVETVQKEFGKYLNEVVFMPIVDLDKPGAEKIIDDYQKTYKPVAFEFIFTKECSADKALLEKVVRNGSKIWINSLWASLNGGHDDDLAIDNIPDSYGWIINKGATLIQTDRPAYLLKYLKEQHLHR